MIKKLIKFSITFNAFSTILISNINMSASNSEIYHSDVVKKAITIKTKIDAVLESLTEITDEINKERSAANGYNNSTNYEYCNGEKYYVAYKSESCSNLMEEWTSSTYAKACIYRLFDEEIVLNPHYITRVEAMCSYVITSWAGNSWKDMEGWLKDRSVQKYQIHKNFCADCFDITDLSVDKREVRLQGHISIDKPNASIYMNVSLESSEKTSPLIKKREYMTGHIGWAVFDSYLLKGTIIYAISDQSRQKIQNIKQKIANFKSELKNALDKLNTYNPDLDRGNDNYESSRLKQILDDCEQAFIKVDNFINLKNSNGWIQKF